MDKNSFVMHKDFFEGIPESEQFKWFNVICGYAFKGEEPQFNNWYESKIWLNIKSRMESDQAAYNKKLEYQRAYQAKKRAEKEKGVEKSFPFKHLPIYDSEFKSESEFEFKSEFESEFKSDSEFKSEFKERGELHSPAREKKGFKPPEKAEVEAYMREKGYRFDVEKFLGHYEANGWKQSNGLEIKSWKGAVAQWNAREKDFAPKTDGFDTTSNTDYNAPEWKQEEW